MQTVNLLLMLSVIFSCNVKGDGEKSPIINLNDGSVWIDVRSKAEFDSGHLPKAIHIPHTEIAEKIELHVSDKTKAIKLYCRSGVRAATAKNVLLKLGFTNVRNEGGLEDILERLNKK